MELREERKEEEDSVGRLAFVLLVLVEVRPSKAHVPF